MKESAVAVDQYEADDIISTDPTGRVTAKENDKKDLLSGDSKFQSMELSELNVRVYGNTAVAARATTLKGTYKEQDISGKYRFTDTWVKRYGKWQVVASQAAARSGSESPQNSRRERKGITTTASRATGFPALSAGRNFHRDSASSANGSSRSSGLLITRISLTCPSE